MIATLAALLLALQPAEEGQPSEYQRCMDAAGNTAALAACTDAAWRREETRMAEALGRALAAVTPVQKPKLEAAQRAWTAFRDAECAVASAAESTMAPVSAGECRAALTGMRADQLEGWAAAEEEPDGPPPPR